MFENYEWYLINFRQLTEATNHNNIEPTKAVEQQDFGPTLFAAIHDTWTKKYDA